MPDETTLKMMKRSVPENNQIHVWWDAFSSLCFEHFVTISDARDNHLSRSLACLCRVKDACAWAVTETLCDDLVLRNMMRVNLLCFLRKYLSEWCVESSDISAVNLLSEQVKNAMNGRGLVSHQQCSVSWILWIVCLARKL